MSSDVTHLVFTGLWDFHPVLASPQPHYVGGTTGGGPGGLVHQATADVEHKFMEFLNLFSMQVRNRDPKRWCDSAR